MAEADPKQTAILAANLSGDADTIAAIACAIAGTYAGFEAFLAEDIAVLENDPVFRAYDARGIAQGLAALIKEAAADE